MSLAHCLVRLSPPARRPYVLDLESTNGTFLNGKRIEPARYIELREKDVLRFGESSREYVLMCATAKQQQAAGSPSEQEQEEDGAVE